MRCRCRSRSALHSYLMLHPPIIAEGEVEKQPGDGSCLYHSLVHRGRELNGHWQTARELRKQLAAFCAANGQVRINGKTLDAWLELEHSVKVRMERYARRQAQCGWGGSLEILAYVLSHNVAVWVWVPCGDGTYRRTTCFDLPAGQAPAGRIDLCYLGGTHYDWLRLIEAEQIGRVEPSGAPPQDVDNPAEQPPVRRSPSTRKRHRRRG